jgi:indole-3-glycerol phosphate synthase
MTILERIFATKREEVERGMDRYGLADMENRALQAKATRGFRTALMASKRKPALIAEVKKASPSEGVIRARFNPETIARIYEKAGAACLSVLTDVEYFQGSAENLKRCKVAVKLPLLRKDFIYHEFQVLESRAMGADAILLIAAMLEREQMGELHALAESLDLDVLVEVHNENEVDAALSIGARLVGVNNRDLATFETDLGTTARLAPLITPHAFLVSESALRTHEDVERAAEAGAGAVLIGTTFCAAEDIGEKVREVMGA